MYEQTIENIKFDFSKLEASLDSHMRMVHCGINDDGVDTATWFDATRGILVNFDRFPNIDTLHISMMGHAKEVLEEFVLKYLFYTGKKLHPKGSLYAILPDGGDLDVRQITSIKSKYIPENYNPEVVEAFEHVRRGIVSKNPCGRVVVVSGKPGTGKTYLVRSLLQITKKVSFVVLPIEMVSNPGGPSMLRTLLYHYNNTNQPIILILEDADQCLVPRGADNMMSISSLLNMGDGLLGQSLDMRVVATTNATHTKIDPAIIRPGRLCRQIKVDALGREQANKVFSRLIDGKPPPVWKSDPTLAEVYAAANGNTPKPQKEGHGVGFRAA